MKRALVTFALCACGSIVQAAAPVDLGRPSERPKLQSIYGETHDLTEFAGDKTNGIVLIFLGTECPVARQYLPRLAELYQQHRQRGVEFLGVFADAGVDSFSLATYAHDADIPYPVMIDVEHRLADLLDVQMTPEVVLLDAKLAKVYQGAIDDQFKRQGRKPAPGENYLADALTNMLAGKPIERAYVPASGCPLERKTPQRAQREITFHRDVATIVQERCQKCHRNGGAGPFELANYDDVASNAEKIRQVVADRRMPPWHGVLNPDFGTLVNSQRLPAEEVESLLGWIDGGLAEGDPADGPAPKEWPAPGAWSIGKPEYVYRMPEPFPVPKTGALEYQFFRVPLDSDADRWFEAIEIKPGTPEVVHHVTLHAAPALKEKRFDGLAVMAQLYGLNGERAHVLGDFVPGDTYNAKRFPSGQGVLIPKHSDLIFEVHYTPNNRAATTDQSLVGFDWADEPPGEPVLNKIFRKAIGGFRIPPHEHHYRVEDTYYFEHDVLVDSIRPHFHLRGKSFRLELIERDPDTDEVTSRKTILSVPVYDPAWQRSYELETPLLVKAGAELLATGHFDNSRLNPNNPDPNKEVLWGQQMTDEMFSTRFKYRLAESRE